MDQMLNMNNEEEEKRKKQVKVFQSYFAGHPSKRIHFIGLIIKLY